jgi:hypothetical protein
VAPWPPVHQMAISLARVGLVAGPVVVAVFVSVRICKRMGLDAAVDVLGALGGVAFFLWLLIGFLYGVSKPDDLLWRYAVRRERNWAYARLLALSFAANAAVLMAVLVLVALIQRVV